MKILIVDDKPENIYLLESILKGNGYKTVSASNGEEALEKLRMEKFDLIISDILMPVMDGYQLCRECNYDPDLRIIPFIFYTATYTEARDEELALRMGAEKFIRKPAEPEEFIKQISEVIADSEKEKIAPLEYVETDDVEKETFKLYSERLVKKLEKKMLHLEASEKKYRRLCENVNDIVFSIDDQARFTHANCRVEMWGYKPSEIIGKSIIELLTPEKAELAMRYFTSAKQGEIDRLIYETKIKAKDGRIINVELSMSSIIENGKFLGRFGVARDITARKMSEVKLKKWAHIFEHAEWGIAVSSKDGKVLDMMNPTYAKMLGFSVDELTGMAIIELFAPEYRDELRDQINLIHEKGHHTFETKLIRKEGSIFPAQIDATAVKDENGNFLYRVVNVLDITERKHMEEEILHRLKVEETIAKISRNFADPGEVNIDALLKILGEIAFCNRTYIFKFQDDGRKMDNTYEWCKPGTEPQIDNLKDLDVGIFPWWMKKLHSGDTINIENVDDLPPEAETEKEILQDQNILSVLVVPINSEKGALSGFMGFDDTENYRKWSEDDAKALRVVGEMIGMYWDHAQSAEALKKSEEQFRQSQKMEGIGRLAGGIAHDFNNLLTVISGYTEMAITSLDTRDPLRNELSEVLNSAHRASELTRQLLAFSRRQTLNPRILNLNGIVNNLNKLLKRLLGEDIEIKINLAHDLWNTLIDPGQVEQVIINLAVNARDAMPEGGKLTIETKNIELDEAYARSHSEVTPGPHVMLIISDTGSGITDEVMMHIFEPFFTTKGEGKGTGLGLSTVFGIIKQSGGNIEVNSELGLGTEFTIYLPMVKEETIDFSPETDNFELPRGKETILLVEDEDSVRKLACRMLEQLGYKVLEAENGGAALLICEELEKPVDLVITDVIMPSMGGNVLIKKLKEKWQDIKVLYISGYTADALSHTGVLDKDKHLLQKPFRQIDLAWKVRRVLDN